MFFVPFQIVDLSVEADAAANQIDIATTEHDIEAVQNVNSVIFICTE